MTNKMGLLTMEKRQVATNPIPPTTIRFCILFGLIMVTAAHLEERVILREDGLDKLF